MGKFIYAYNKNKTGIKNKTDHKDATLFLLKRSPLHRQQNKTKSFPWNKIPELTNENNIYIVALTIYDFLREYSGTP